MAAQVVAAAVAASGDAGEEEEMEVGGCGWWGCRAPVGSHRELKRGSAAGAASVGGEVEWGDTQVEVDQVPGVGVDCRPGLRSGGLLCMALCCCMLR